MNDKLKRFKNGEIALKVQAEELYNKLMQWCKAQCLRSIARTAQLEWEGVYFGKETTIKCDGNNLLYGEAEHYIKSGFAVESVTESDFEFSKSDLQTGMVIELGNGLRYLVLRGSFEFCLYKEQELFFQGQTGFLLGSDYDESIKSHNDNSFDIVAVYKPPCSGLKDMFYDCSEENIVWKRESKEKQQLKAEIDKLQHELVVLQKRLGETA